MNAWAHNEWKDNRFKWNPADFGGLDSIQLESSEVWLPDVTLYNSIGSMDSDYIGWEKTSRVVVKNTGDVVFVPPVTYRSMCGLTNPGEYPWGEQNCTLTFGSWAYDKGQLDIVPQKNNYSEPVDTRYFQNKRVRALVKSCCPREGEQQLFCG